MGRRKHKQTYDGHKHRFYIYDKDQYHCSYPKCRRRYKDVNWVLKVLNNTPGLTFSRPIQVKEELMTIVVGLRR